MDQPKCNWLQADYWCAWNKRNEVTRFIESDGPCCAFITMQIPKSVEIVRFFFFFWNSLWIYFFFNLNIGIPIKNAHEVSRGCIQSWHSRVWFSRELAHVHVHADFIIVHDLIARMCDFCKCFGLTWNMHEKSRWLPVSLFLSLWLNLNNSWVYHNTNCWYWYCLYWMTKGELECVRKLNIKTSDWEKKTILQTQITCTHTIFMAILFECAAYTMTSWISFNCDSASIEWNYSYASLRRNNLNQIFGSLLFISDECNQSDKNWRSHLIFFNALFVCWQFKVVSICAKSGISVGKNEELSNVCWTTTKVNLKPVYRDMDACVSVCTRSLIYHKISVRCDRTNERTNVWMSCEWFANVLNANANANANMTWNIWWLRTLP